MALGTLVGRGFVRIDADTTPARKAILGLGAIGSQAGIGALSATIAPITAATMALASSFAVAGGAAVAFGAAVVPQFQEITKAMQGQKTAEDARTKAAVSASIAQDLAKRNGFKYGQQVKITADMTKSAKAAAVEYNAALSTSDSASKSAKQSQALYKQQLNSMPKATQDTSNALLKLKDSTQQWSASLSGSTMPIFTRGINFLRSLLPSLTPIVRSTAKEISGFVSSLGEGTAGRVFREFGANVTKNGAGALRTFLNITRNVIVGVIGLFNAFTPASKGVTGGLEEMTRKFAEWSAGLSRSNGFQQWLDDMRAQGPGLMKTFSQIAKTIFTVIQAMGPLAGLSLKTAQAFATIISAIPTPVLKVLAQTIILTNVALKLFAIYQSAAAAATWLFTTSVTANTGVIYTSRLALIAHRIILIAQAAATVASTVATTAWTFALRAGRLAILAFRYAMVALRLAVLLTATGFRVLAVAMIANPIGAIIALIIALGLAFIVAWKKSDTFRNGIKAGLRAVRDAAFAVGRWFTGPFVNFFVAVWKQIKKYMVDPWIHLFTKTLPSTVRFARDKVVSLFRWMVLRVVDNFGLIIKGAARMLGWVPGVGGKLKKAERAFEKFRDGVNRALGGIKNKNQTTFVTFKGKSIAAVSAGRMATGGPISGPGTETSDSVPILASRDEHMWTAREVRGVGGHGRMAQLRAMARKGLLPRFAAGGAVNPIARVPSAKAINSTLSSAYVRMVKSSSSALRKLRDSVEGAFGGSLNVGGSGVTRWTGAVKQALAAVGQSQSYVGITLRRMNQESGGNPRAVNKWDSNWKAGYPSVGLMQVIRPTFQSNAGKYRNTGPFMYGVSIAPIANLYASMRYALRAYGSLPRAYNRAGGYDLGGIARGAGFIPKLTNAPERVLSPRQTAVFEEMMGHPSSGRRVGITIDKLVIENHGVIASRQEAEDWLVSAMVTLKKKNRLP